LKQQTAVEAPEKRVNSHQKSKYIEDLVKLNSDKRASKPNMPEPISYIGQINNNNNNINNFFIQDVSGLFNKNEAKAASLAMAASQKRTQS